MPSRVPSHRPRTLPPPSRHAEYDRSRRDQEAKVFYNSQRWQLLRRMKLRQHPLCERCRAADLLVPATVVHHRIERRAATELEMELTNLEALCRPCHSRHHATAATASTSGDPTHPGGGGDASLGADR